VTTGACDVQGVVSGEARFPLRDGVVIEVEGCDVAMSTKPRSCPMKLPFPKSELSREKRMDQLDVLCLGCVDVRGRINKAYPKASIQYLIEWK
jgi:hypothetical protein